MTVTTVLLVRHAKAADRELWTGPDRDRTLIERGRKQARRLGRAIALEQPVLVATSPWVRCRQTADVIAAACDLSAVDDERLGYDAPDLAGWIAEVRHRHAGVTVVGVSHGDLIPDYLVEQGLLHDHQAFRTGSLFRLDLNAGTAPRVAYVDRADLPGDD